MVHSAISDTNFQAYIYDTKYMFSWEPVEIDPADRDEIEEEANEWGDDLRADLERRFKN